MTTNTNLTITNTIKTDNAIIKQLRLGSGCVYCNEKTDGKMLYLQVKADANENNFKYVCEHCINSIKHNKKATFDSSVYGVDVKNKTETTINLTCDANFYNLGLLLANRWHFEILDNKIHAHGINKGHKQCKARLYNDLQGVSDINYTIRCTCGCGKVLHTTDYTQTMPSVVSSFAYSIKMHR